MPNNYEITELRGTAQILAYAKQMGYLNADNKPYESNNLNNKVSACHKTVLAKAKSPELGYSSKLGKKKFSLVTAPAQAKSELDTRLETFVQFAKEVHKQKRFDGALVVVQGERELLQLQSQNITVHKPQFMIGSVSKQFFAVALLKALYESAPNEDEADKIAFVKRELHMPLSHFLPKDSPLWSGHMPSWADEITLHHLLSHTSGIANFTETEAYDWYESYHTPSEIISRIANKPSLFPAGSQYSYCNTGYLLIAEVIEAITSQPASEYLDTKLFKPLGLLSTYNPLRGNWKDLQTEPRTSRLVEPYQFDPREDQSTTYPFTSTEDIGVAKGGGSIISTTSDLIKWNSQLHKEQSVLPKELYTLLTTENFSEYGYGIHIQKPSTGTLLFHPGAIGAFEAILFYIPKNDLSIALLSNIGYDFKAIEEEYKLEFEKLKNIHSDESKAKAQAEQFISQKYRPKRGFGYIADKIGELFK